MTRRFDKGARSVTPGALPGVQLGMARTHRGMLFTSTVLLTAALLMTSCGTGGTDVSPESGSTGGATPMTDVTASPPDPSIPPTGTTDRPAPMPDTSGPPGPTPSVTKPVQGSRERRVPVKVVSSSGRELVVEVVAGGPPCEAVTGLDVEESSTEVRIAAWVGRTWKVSGCDESQPPAVAAIMWVEVTLAEPLGSRSVSSS